MNGKICVIVVLFDRSKFFFFQSTYLFIYLLLAALGVFCCAWASSDCGKQGLFSSCGVQASHCGGFSFCRARALECTGFSSCGASA